MNSSEGSIERAFCRKLLKYGYKAQKCPIGGGWPDRMFFREPGFVAWAEFKTLTGRVSKRQQLIHTRLRTHGFLVFILRGSSDEEVEATVNAMEAARVSIKGR